MSQAADDEEQLRVVLLKLQSTRGALRRELLPEEESARLREQADRAAGREPRAPSAAAPARWWRRLRRMARHSPLLDLAAQSLDGWWRRQPWHDGSRQLSRQIQAQGGPLIRRHPLTAVAIAGAAGAALVALRPWQWPLLRAPLRAAPSRVSGWVLTQLASAPVQAALLALLMDALRSPKPDDHESQGADTDTR